MLCKCACKERFVLSRFLGPKMNDDVPALLSMSQSFFGTVDVNYINGLIMCIISSSDDIYLMSQ